MSASLRAFSSGRDKIESRAASVPPGFVGSGEGNEIADLRRIDRLVEDEDGFGLQAKLAGSSSAGR